MKSLGLEKGNSFKEILIKSGSSLGVRIVSRLLAYLFILLTIRLLGVSFYGKWVLIHSIFFFSCLLSSFGMKEVAVFFIASNKVGKISQTSFIRKASLLVIGSSILGSLLLYLFKEEVGLLFNKTYLEEYIPIICFAILPFNFIEFSSGILKGKKLTLSYSILETLVQPISYFTSITVILACSLRSVENALIVFCIVLVIVAIFCAFLLLKDVVKLNEDERESTYQEIIKISGSMFRTKVANAIQNRIDLLLLGVFCNELYISAYAIAIKLVKILDLPIMSINSIIAPKFRNLFTLNNLGELKRTAKVSTRLISMVVFMPSILLIIFGKQLISIFDDKLVFAFTCLGILVVGQLFNTISGSIGQLLQMSENYKIVEKVAIATSVLTLGLAFLLIPSFDILGAAISVSVSIIFNNSMLSYFSNKELGFNTFLSFKSHD